MKKNWTTMPEVDRNPNEWGQCFLWIAQNINPGYSLNKDRKLGSKGVEFIRRLDNGLYVSHNYFKKPYITNFGLLKWTQSEGELSFENASPLVLYKPALVLKDNELYHMDKYHQRIKKIEKNWGADPKYDQCYCDLSLACDEHYKAATRTLIRKAEYLLQKSILKFSYRHCFSVLLSKKLLWNVASFVGGRFDANYLISDGLKQMQEEPVTSRHHGSSNAQAMVTTAMHTAEDRLLPHYLDILQKGKGNLLGFFETAAELLRNYERSDIESLSQQVDRAFLRRNQGLISADVIANGTLRCYRDILLVNYDELYALADELPSLLDTIAAL